MYRFQTLLISSLFLSSLACNNDPRNSHRSKGYTPITIIATKLERHQPNPNRKALRVPCRRTEGYYPGYLKSLPFNFYEPKKGDQVRPLIIFLHEGAFVAGDQNDYLTNQFCTDFARLGYATAAIEYTKVTDFGSFKSLALPAQYVKNKIYEAFRDAQSAVRYFKENAAKYNIDPDRVFVSGFSAGAILSLQCAFLDADEAAGFFKNEMPFEREKLAGIVAISGGMFDLGHMNDEENPPLLLMHGSDDDMVPFDNGQPLARYRHDINIDLPGFLLSIGISQRQPDGSSVENRISAPKMSLYIPEWMPAALINSLTDPIHGGKDIYTRVFDDCTFIPIKNGNHTFMMTPKTGELNAYYYEISKAMDVFFAENSQVPRPARKTNQCVGIDPTKTAKSR